MFASFLRLLLHIVLSPRRVIIAALLATFFYAAFVATKVRLFPESGPTADRVARAGERVHPVPGRSDDHLAGAARGARGE